MEKSPRGGKLRLFEKRHERIRKENGLERARAGGKEETMETGRSCITPGWEASSLF